MKKRVLYISLLFAFLIYGFAVGFFKIFPLPQLMALKHYVEFTKGTFESQENQFAMVDSVEVYETFLERLLIKKLQLPGFSGHGGGLAPTKELLYVVTNKGDVQTYDINRITPVEDRIDGVPMNFEDLIRSGHPYKNDFRIHWFRVNGVYAERIDADTHVLYVSHNSYEIDRDCITHNVSRIELTLDWDLDIPIFSQTDGWVTIFTASPCIDPEPETLASATPYPGHISGGAIIGYNEEELLVTVGDYNRHGIAGSPEYAMDRSNPYGKYLLMDKETGEWSIFAVGSRNVPDLYIDRDSLIWSVENGPMGGDELNIIARNENYGWPKVSMGVWYDPNLALPGLAESGRHSGYREPVFSWLPSVAPSSLVRIEGARFEQWHGDLLMGTMRDQSLHRLRLGENNRVVYDERIHLGHRIRDIVTLPDHKLALVTDDGFLMIIDDGGPVFREPNQEARNRLAFLESLNQVTDTSQIEKIAVSSRLIYQENCASCHNLDARNQIGPHLYRLLDREVGALDNFSYSQTLKSDTRNWNARLLRQFLENPDEEFPGIQMQKIDLNTSEVDSLVQFFQSQNKLVMTN